MHSMNYSMRHKFVKLKKILIKELNVKKISVRVNMISETLFFFPREEKKILKISKRQRSHVVHLCKLEKCKKII